MPRHPAAVFQTKPYGIGRLFDGDEVAAQLAEQAANQAQHAGQQDKDSLEKQEEGTDEQVIAEVTKT